MSKEDGGPAFRAATLSESLQILMSRLSEHLSPAEKRDLQAAIKCVDAPAPLPEGMGLRPEVLVFAEAMEAKLRENDHKKPWRECTPEYLLDCLYTEVRELDESLDFNPPQPDKVLSEAVDVANFAMFLATDEIDALLAAKGGK